VKAWKRSALYEDGVPGKDENGMSPGQIQIEITRIGDVSDDDVWSMLMKVAATIPRRDREFGT